jgi:hypothetical protein
MDSNPFLEKKMPAIPLSQAYRILGLEKEAADPCQALLHALKDIVTRRQKSRVWNRG